MKPKRKLVVNATLVTTEYRIYRGQLKDFVLEHWYPNWLFRCTIETFIYELADGSKLKQSEHTNTEYCYRLNQYSESKNTEHWAWCATQTQFSNIQYKIDKNFIICSRVVNHCSDEKIRALLYSNNDNLLQLEL